MPLRSMPLHSRRPSFRSGPPGSSLARELISCFPNPAVDEACRKARAYASMSLYRMLRTADAREILETDYDFWSAGENPSEALYAASLLTEIAICEGDLELAREWFAEAKAYVRSAPAHKISPNSGYASSAALLSMLSGRYEEAEAFISTPQVEYARMRSACSESVCIALVLRSQLLRGVLGDHLPLVTRLKELYTRGRPSGGQDTVVEMLWCADITAGRNHSASALLRDYLGKYRHEPSPPEWFLSHTTTADAWATLSPVHQRR